MDPITSTMMNSSCNEYNNIKAEFRRILSELQLIENNIDDYLKENDINVAEITKIMQTKKGLEKLINKY
jgi:peptidoglycan hydrolase CwlO-like protein